MSKRNMVRRDSAELHSEFDDAVPKVNPVRLNSRDRLLPGDLEVTIKQPVGPRLNRSTRSTHSGKVVKASAP